MKKDKTATAVPEGEVRVLAVETCPSITRKSKLTYHVGILGSEIQLKIHANSGGGFFSEEWVPLSDILDRLPPAGPFTSRVLNTLFTGKSTNTPGFLMAVLRNEGLVQPSTSKRRCWELGNVMAFEQQVEAMMDTPLSPKKKLPAGAAKKPAAALPKPTTAKPAKASKPGATTKPGTTKPVPAGKPRARK